MEIRNKKKVGILSIAALAGITIIGSSVAYFTSTDTKDNLFTVGSVRTILHEDRWDDLADTDHNGIPDMAEDIIPNKTIPKDPTIENTGKNPAWVYLEVRVPIVNIITAQEDGSRNPKADTELFLFTPDLDHWRQLSKIVEEDTDGRKTAVYVFGYESVLDPGQTTAELFSSVTFCNAIEEQGLEDSVWPSSRRRPERWRKPMEASSTRNMLRRNLHRRCQKMEKQLWMMEVTMNEAQEEMVPRLPVGRDHPYNGPLQYRLSDACGNEREQDNDWTERCHDRRGFHTSQAVAAGDDVRKGREGPQYRQRPLLYPRLRSAFRYGHPCAYGLRYEGLDTGR